MNLSPAIVEHIRSGLQRLGPDPAWRVEAGGEAAAAPRFAAYLALLVKWNRVYNLTAVRDPRQMVTHHLLDSLALLPNLGAPVRLADVGSGAGLPGIPLAIARPQMAVTLIESNQKKAAFLQQARIELKLDNVSIHCGRVEEYRPNVLFDAVVSRAFSDLALFVRVAGHLLAPGAPLLAMKGVEPRDEIADLPAGWRVGRSIPIVVPGLAAQRHLIVIEPS
ncbi:methyltransferase, SAM-dependent methyltransferase, glucose-inhibited cell-division protein [Sterolibacterium denitrificans]|uniref:Ribosomal RNA small subunit methyltransferase G n=1 Tax=Sterolibacterium denitrificans TaxID=157592 RepID=A0A7Z7HPR8_9PROT|nr:16S rRNA (guanine(527)-N(7))-methyltransferase RsmG [Sterolibacterium denitrificans]SMB21680.1 methyltransferase, SAM-dependent methyltransferase, glucose-inhibited cell-division protein [Sterolibacterium denitrificans]